MKKKLAATLSVVLILGLATLGILAYLTSEDSDVNVMTLGNVSIEQHEYQRATNDDGTYQTGNIDNQTSYVLEDFEQLKPLLPIVGDPNEPGNSPEYAGWDATSVRMTQVDSYGSMQVFAGKNAQDKFVTVENTGKSDAYVRTLVAIEVGEADPALVGKSYHGTWVEKQLGTIEIESNNYYVSEFVYAGGQLSDGTWRHENGILPAGDTSYPNLSQVYLKSKTTNEDCEALDGNKNGVLDILVLSQAVQTAGFDNAQTALDTAFGKANAANVAAWFTTSTKDVDSADDLDAALEHSGVIDLNDQTISKDGQFRNTGNTVAIKDGTLAAGNAGDYASVTAGGATTYDNVDIESAGGAIGAVAGAQVTFNSGSAYVDSASTSGRYVFYAEGAGTVITINGGSFSWDKADNQKRAYIYASEGTTVYVNGGTFGPASTRSGYTAGILGNGTVIITGGTFGFNPSNWVADGYEAVKDGTTWTVSAK